MQRTQSALPPTAYLLCHTSRRGNISLQLTCSSVCRAQVRGLRRTYDSPDIRRVVRTQLNSRTLHSEREAAAGIRCTGLVKFRVVADGCRMLPARKYGFLLDIPFQRAELCWQ